MIRKTPVPDPGQPGHGTAKPGAPVYECEPKTWGPGEVEWVTPPGGWANPVVAD